MACNIPICIYVKFDIRKANLRLIVGGMVMPVAKLKLMPAYNQYAKEFRDIRAAHAMPVELKCDPQCHCAKPSTKPVVRNVPVPPQVLDSGRLPPGGAWGGTPWTVEVTGITYTQWIGFCLPTGAKIKVGRRWVPAEIWGQGWDRPPMDRGGSGSKSKAKKKRKKSAKKRAKPGSRR